MKASTLVIAGTGIKFISHLTHEVEVYIQNSSKILYLSNEPAIEEWIKSKHLNTESLYDYYTRHESRLKNYQEIANKILSDVNKFETTLVLLYGHPTVYAMPALEAAIKARKQNVEVIILPGISADACLYADLMIDPGSAGCQSYDATDFLIKNKIIDNTSHTILWQIGSIGSISLISNYGNKTGIRLLKNKLSELFTPNHPVTVYEASQYPHFRPRIDDITIEDLENIELTALSTLYIPPINVSTINNEILDKLNLSIDQLK